MTKISNATFNGKVGTYNFEVYSLDTAFNAVGGVYIFTKRTVAPGGHGTHDLLYIGETESFRDRIPNHEKRPCVDRNGANCICLHRDDTEASRIRKETDLRLTNSTPCNDQ